MRQQQFPPSFVTGNIRDLMRNKPVLQNLSHVHLERLHQDERSITRQEMVANALSHLHIDRLDTLQYLRLAVDGGEITSFKGYRRNRIMDITDIKKVVAGLCVAGLVSGAGCAFGASSDGTQPGSGRANLKIASGMTGCSG